MKYSEHSRVSALSELVNTLVSSGLGEGTLQTIGNCFSHVHSGGVALIIPPDGDKLPKLKGSWGELGWETLSAAEQLVSKFPSCTGPLRMQSDNNKLDPIWAIPIKFKDELFGCIWLGKVDNQRIDEDMPYIEAIAGELTEAIEEERALREIERLEGKMIEFKNKSDILYEVINTVHSSLDLDQILKIVLKCTTAGCALGFNRAFLFLLDHMGKYLEGKIAVGPTSIEDAYRIWSELESNEASLESIVSSEGDSDLELTEKVSGIKFPMELDEGPIARAMRERKTIWVDEDDGKGPVEQKFSEAFEMSSFAVAPLIGKMRLLGVIVADNPFSERIVTEQDIDFLGMLAGQAALAIENSTVHERVKRRVSELEMLYEVSEAILSTLDLGVEMNLIARISAQVLAAKGSILHLVDQKDGKPRVHGAWNVGEEFRHEKIFNMGDSVARWVMEHGEPFLTADAESDPRFPGTSKSGIKSLICVPLSLKEKLIGTITVYNKTPKGHDQPFFTSDDREFLAILANEAAIAIENARLFEKVRSTEARLREMQEILLRSEKLAALGKMIAQVSHEIRNPLVSVGGFARLALKSIPEGDPNREYINIIVKEVERLEDILKKQLDLGKFSELNPSYEDINDIIGETLVMVEQETRSRDIEIITKFSRDIPRVLVDAGRMKQVFLNIFSSSIGSMKEGGILEVSSYSDPQSVYISVSDTGSGISKETFDRLFIPFTSDKSDSAELGLAVAQRIIVDHGGTIDIGTGPDKGASFIIRLPLRLDGKEQSGENLADS